MESRKINRIQRGGKKIGTVLPGDTEETYFDDEVDPFSSHDASPSEHEIMRATETKRRWVEQAKKQRHTATVAARYNKLGKSMKTPKKSVAQKSVAQKSVGPHSKKTTELDTNSLFEKLGVLSKNPVAGNPQRRKSRKSRKRHTKRKHQTKRKHHTKRKHQTKRKHHTKLRKNRRRTKRKRGGSDSEWYTEEDDEEGPKKALTKKALTKKALTKKASTMSQLEKRLQKTIAGRT